MTLNIAICDDEIKCINLLCRFLNEYSFRFDIDFRISSFSSGKDLINSYNKSEKYNILFLDIELPKENGIDIAYTVKHYFDKNVLCIFVSNYPKYMYDCFSVHPYQFIQKPITAAIIEKLMSDIISDIDEQSIYITIIDDTEKKYTLNINDLYYIETINAKSKDIAFYTNDNKIITKGTLTDWKNRLADNLFVPCSRTVFVNLLHIHYFQDEEIILDNDTKIHVSKRCKKAIMDEYLNKVVAVRRNTRL